MWRDFIDTIFPNFCQACADGLSRNEKLICTGCVASLPYTHYHEQPENPLSMRFWGKIPLRHALAYLQFSRSGRVQSLLHKLKYSGQREIGTLLGQWYGSVLKQTGLQQEFDIIVPVPLHAAKLKKRGFNQADFFAEGLSAGMEVEWSNEVLQRTTNNSTQTNKSRLDRWRNVDAIFQVKDAAQVQGKRFLIVDDVITTGSTLEACAHALLNAGAKEVSIAAIAAAQ